MEQCTDRVRQRNLNNQTPTVCSAPAVVLFCIGYQENLHNRRILRFREMCQLYHQGCQSWLLRRKLLLKRGDLRLPLSLKWFQFRRKMKQDVALSIRLCGRQEFCRNALCSGVLDRVVDKKGLLKAVTPAAFFAHFSMLLEQFKVTLVEHVDRLRPTHILIMCV